MAVSAFGADASARRLVAYRNSIATICRRSMPPWQHTLPKQAFNLTRMMVSPPAPGLLLAFNQLSGSLPASWGSPAALPLLGDLYLHGNKLTGPLPPQW